MKLYLISCAFICNISFAQDTTKPRQLLPVQELSFSTGYFTRPQMEAGLRGRHYAVYTSGMYDKERTIAPLLFSNNRPFDHYGWQRTGSLALTYRHLISRKVSAGASICYEENKRDIGYDSQRLGFQKMSALTLAGGFKISYYKHRFTELYCAAEGGATRTTNKYVNTTNKIRFTDPNVYNFLVQFSPIGLRVGKRLGGFAELGFGFKGIIQLGCSFRP